MSARNSHTTADVLPWDSAISLIHRLYKDGDYRFSLLIATGIFCGLRITDIRAFRWNDLMGADVIEVIEHKTKKHRQIKLIVLSSPLMSKMRLEKHFLRLWLLKFLMGTRYLVLISLNRLLIHWMLITVCFCVRKQCSFGFLMLSAS